MKRTNKNIGLYIENTINKILDNVGLRKQNKRLNKINVSLAVENEEIRADRDYYREQMNIYKKAYGKKIINKERKEIEK